MQHPLLNPEFERAYHEHLVDMFDLYKEEQDGHQAIPEEMISQFFYSAADYVNEHLKSNYNFPLFGVEHSTTRGVADGEFDMFSYTMRGVPPGQALDYARSLHYGGTVAHEGVHAVQVIRMVQYVLDAHGHESREDQQKRLSLTSDSLFRMDIIDAVSAMPEASPEELEAGRFLYENDIGVAKARYGIEPMPMSMIDTLPDFTPDIDTRNRLLRADAALQAATKDFEEFGENHRKTILPAARETYIRDDAWRQIVELGSRIGGSSDGQKISSINRNILAIRLSEAQIEYNAAGYAHINSPLEKEARAFESHLADLDPEVRRLVATEHVPPAPPRLHGPGPIDRAVVRTQDIRGDVGATGQSQTSVVRGDRPNSLSESLRALWPSALLGRLSTSTRQRDQSASSERQAQHEKPDPGVSQPGNRQQPGSGGPSRSNG